MGVVRFGSGSAMLWLLALVLAFPGCGFEGDLPTPPAPPSPPVPPTQASLLLSLSSSPIDAVVPTDGSTAFSAAWTLSVKETAGIGGAIDSVRATLVDAGGATIAETELDVPELSEQLGGSNRIGGGSDHGIAMSMSFNFPDETATGNLHVSVQMTDDRGNPVSAGLDDVVQICVPAQLTPAPGESMDNGCSNGQNGISWEFDWDDCPAADLYSIHIDHPSLEQPIDRDLPVSAFSLLEQRAIPEDSRIGWTWKVRARVNGIWGNYSPDRTFDVERLNTDCVTP